MNGHVPTSHTSIEELRQEFESNHVRGWLWPWLAERLEVFVRLRIARRYQPGVYSPSGNWDAEGIRDLVTDFLVHRGIEGGAILAGLQRATNSRGLIAYLERALKNYTVSQRVKTVAHNVWGRLVQALDDDPELACMAGFGSRRAAYGYYEWADNPPSVLVEEDLAAASAFMPAGIKLFEYGTGDRQSPGLSTNDLRAIAHSVIHGTGRLATASQIMSLVERRFDLGERTVELDDATCASARTFNLDPLEQTVATDLGGRFVRSLNDRQLQIFRALISEDPPLTIRAVAARLGISKSVVQREQKALAEVLIRLHVTAADEQAQVIAAASNLI